MRQAIEGTKRRASFLTDLRVLLSFRFNFDIRINLDMPQILIREY